MAKAVQYQWCFFKKAISNIIDTRQRKLYVDVGKECNRKEHKQNYYVLAKGYMCVTETNCEIRQNNEQVRI